MRYALGDLIQIFTQPCQCGWPEMRFKILGRTDDMLIIKGVNIYPVAIKGVVAEFMPRATGVLCIVLDGPGPLVKPPLRIRVEYGSEDMSADEKNNLIQEITDHIRNQLRVTPFIELVPPHSLPRESGKTSLVEIKERK
jgi:phenylacetate-CoA ligase